MEQNMVKFNPLEGSGEIVDDANFIWGIADNIRNAYMPDKYGDVIIPMTIDLNAVWNQQRARFLI